MGLGVGGREREDDTEEVKLLSPSPLPFWSPNTISSGLREKNVAGGGKATKESAVFGTGAKGIVLPNVTGNRNCVAKKESLC